MRSDQKMPEALVDVFQDTVDRPIAFHPVFAKLTGNVTAGLLLSQAVYWTKRATSGGWFFKTIKQWEEETTLSRHEQETARKTLRRFSFWHEERRGVPAQMYYRVDMAVLYNELLSIAESRKSGITSNKEEKRGLRSRLPESGKLNSRKPANKNAGKRHTGMPDTGKHYKGITESTSENTITPLTPLQNEDGTDSIVCEPVDGSSRCKVIDKALLGTVLAPANSAAIARAADKYHRSNDEVATVIDVLDLQYRKSRRPIGDPTTLITAVLKDGIELPEDYSPRAQRNAEAAKRRESASEKTDKERRAKEAEDKAYEEAKAKLSALSQEKREELFTKAKAKLPHILRNSNQAIKAQAIEMLIQRATDTS